MDAVVFGISWPVIAAAFILDALAGDPRWLPHPIIWMGKGISYFEPRFRGLIRPPLLSGLVFALFLITLAGGLSWLAIFLAFKLHTMVGTVLQVVLLFYCFSAKSLSQAAMDVAIPLIKGDLAIARIKVGYIVGRETHNLDEAGITRAACETVAENFVDGFLSPLFFALLFGVPGAMTYKMINTLDSMVGYKNDTYLFFGRASARIDDLANYIPARLSVAVISLAAALLSLSRGKQSFKTALSQGRNHKSPNAGFPEAAFAGALAVRFGGPNFYHGQLVEKPYIGSGFKDPKPSHIRQSCELMMMSALVAVCLSCLFLWGIQ
ncbi:MAG: adenosylcobinamide-phosphate synthase CbiB [Desulfobacterales bacterium]|nr:adenosylcobinamide-phosphate synthase CbiB [Desulfobacterales bacterium]